MNEVEFLRPRLCGARFEGGVIPLEILKDLAVLEEMLIEVAKWRFLQEHPERQRLPRGFTKGIELKLSAVEEGSAVPVISLFDTSPRTSMMVGQNGSYFVSYFEQARESIVNAIGEADQDDLAINHLPKKHLVYFNRIGRSLHTDECIEFVTPQQSTPVRLTQEIRRKLILASSGVKRNEEITESVALRGLIPEADQDRRTFKLQLLNGYTVTIPIPDLHIDTILKAFNGYRQNTQVLLQGIGKYDSQNRLIGMESFEHINLFESLDIPARLDEFRDMKDGWLEGEGVAPSLDGLDWLAVTFDRHFPNDLPLPYLYPTPEGGVQAEWSLSANEISLEVDLVTRQGAWHQLDMNTNADDARKLNLDDVEDWTWVVAEIRKMVEGEI